MPDFCKCLQHSLSKKGMNNISSHFRLLQMSAHFILSRVKLDLEKILLKCREYEYVKVYGINNIGSFFICNRVWLYFLGVLIQQSNVLFISVVISNWLLNSDPSRNQSRRCSRHQRHRLDDCHAQSERSRAVCCCLWIAAEMCQRH